MDRWASRGELLLLQGFPIFYKVDHLDDSAFRKQIGNAMTVDVFEAVFEAILQQHVLVMEDYTYPIRHHHPSRHHF
eukprot:1682100-Prymnesium_polylepis.1